MKQLEEHEEWEDLREKMVKYIYKSIRNSGNKLQTLSLNGPLFFLFFLSVATDSGLWDEE